MVKCAVFPAPPQLMLGFGFQWLQRVSVVDGERGSTGGDFVPCESRNFFLLGSEFCCISLNYLYYLLFRENQ